MSQLKYSTELNIELGSEGRPVLRLGFLLPQSLFLLAQIHTVGLCAGLLHTLPVWPAEGCFKVSLSHVLMLELSFYSALFLYHTSYFPLSVFIWLQHIIQSF